MSITKPNCGAPSSSRPGKFTPDQIGTYYDEWTAKYCEFFGDTLQACRTKDVRGLHQYVLEHSRMKAGDRILDAGCGVCGPSGYFAQQLDVQIEAVTVSQTQVDAARKHLRELGVAGRVNVHRGDYHRLAEMFEENSFDVAVFLESFSHATDPAAVLSSAYRVLKPGGILYLKDYFRNTELKDDELARGERVVHNVDQTFRCNTPTFRSVVRDLHAQGFDELHSGALQFEADDAVWNGFNDKYGFDLYEGGAVVHWVFWGELCFQKPV